MKKHLLFLCIGMALTLGLFAAPLNEGFEGTWPPTDWTIMSSGNASNAIVQTSDQANTGTYSARFSSYYSGTPYDEYVITPQLVTTSGDQTVSFWYRKYSSGSEVFKVGWSSTGTDLSTDFTWSDEITNASTTWQQFVKADLPVGTKYVAIHYYSNYAYYLYIDDVSGPELFVPEFPAPTALVGTDITQTTASLGWTENGEATSWNIEWGEAGFTQGEGTMISATSENPYPLAGLTAGTGYDFYVQSVVEESTSEWAGPETFVTMPPDQGFPLTEDFESGFVKFGNATGNDVNWALDTTIYHGGVQSVGNPYGASNENILHETGILDLSSTTVPILKFWQIAKTEGGWDKCYVEISTDGGATYVALPAAAYQGSGSGYATAGYFDEDDYAIWGTVTEIPDNTWWKEETFNLSAYKVADVRLRFRLTSDGSGQRAGWYLDDIEVKEQQTTPVFSIDPTSKDFGAVTLNTTSSAQTFTITNTGGGTLTIVEDGISIVGANADQFTLTDENVYPINLAAFGTATVDLAFAPTSAGAKTATLQIVDNITEATNTAALSGTGFDPNISSLPYTQDFDSVTTPDLPIGWAKINDSGSTSAYVETYGSESTSHSGSNHVRMYNYSYTSANLMLISPSYARTVNNTRVTFWARTSYGNNNISVGTITDPMDPATFTSIETVALTSTYAEFTVNLGAGTDTYVALKHGQDASYDNNYIDDFTWEEIPAQPVFSIDPETYDFGTSIAGYTSEAETFTITNSGGGDLVINSAIAITGADAVDFQLTDGHSYPLTIALGNSETVDVAFAPTSAGEKTANLQIIDNTTGETTHLIPLTGKAYPADYVFEGFETAVPPAGWTNDGWSRSTTSYEGSGSAYRYGSSSTQYLLYTPKLTVASGDVFSFWARNSSTSGSLEIVYSADGTTWSLLETITYTESNTWKHQEVDLSTVAESSIYIGFRTGLYGSSHYIDNVIHPAAATLPAEVPTNPSPADLAIDVLETSDLTWTNGFGTDTIDFYFGTEETPTTKVLDNVNAVETYTPDLAYNTTYYWKVVCKNGYSEDEAAGPVWSFTTRVDPTLVAPFLEDFTGGYPATNWTEAAGKPPVGTTSSWNNDGFANNGTTGSARVEIWSTGCDEWMITPPIDLGSTTDYVLSFDLALTQWNNSNAPSSVGDDDRFEVWISTSATDWTAASTLQVWDNTTTPAYGDISYTGEEVVIDLSSYSEIVWIGFYGESTVSNADNNLYVDNVAVRELYSGSDFTAFSFAEQAEPATINVDEHTINVTVSVGTALTALVPSFTLSAGAEATVGGVVQVSGVTANDFTNPVTYTVEAEDGTIVDWVVTVNVASSPAFTINPTSNDFGTVDVGSSSDPTTFTITNTGGGELIISNVAFADATHFTLDDANEYPLSLRANDIMTVDVLFSPQADGPITTDLNVTDNLDQVNAVTLSGIGHGLDIQEPNNEFTTATQISPTDTQTWSSDVSSEIYPQDDLDFYKFTATAGAVVTLTQVVNGLSQLDGEIALYDADETLITNVDNAGSGSDEQLVYSIPTTGMYYVVHAYYGDLPLPSSDDEIRVHGNDLEDVKRGKRESDTRAVDGAYLFTFSMTSPPVISVTPPSIAKTVDFEGSGTELLTIGNTGEADLEFTALVDFTVTQYFVNEGFEDGFGTFTDESAGEWAISTTYYHSGTQSVHDAYSAYADDILITTNPIDLTDVPNAVLSFWHIPYLEGGSWDNGYVEVTNDDGTTWSLLASYNKYDCDPVPGQSTALSNDAWIYSEIDLASYADESIKIRFRLDSDSSVQYAGWAIDDVAISASPSWLTLTDDSGTVNSGATADVTLNFDAAGMDSGTYNANVVVSSNGGEDVTVPVTFTVEAFNAVTPASIAIVDNGDGTMTINWDAVDHARSYYVYIAATPDAETWTQVQVDTNSYTYTVDEAKMFFKVTSSDASMSGDGVVSEKGRK